jgi:hypothetical protein
MKIHSFKVAQRGAIAFGDVISHLMSLPIESRLRNVTGTDIRLEDASPDGRYLDFGCIRHDGPGRASATDPITDFDLGDHEGFGQETAAYFEPGPAQILTVQYNHYGPRASKIQLYLLQFARIIGGKQETVDPSDDKDGFSLSPVLKSEAAERLKHMGLVKKIKVSLFVPGVLAGNNLSQPSLGSLLSNPLVGSSETFSFSLSVSRTRGKTLSLEHVRQIAAELLGSRDDVSKIQITGMESDDSPREPLDLLQARLEADPPIPRIGRRYDRKDRWAALKQTYDIWLSNGQLA